MSNPSVSGMRESRSVGATCCVPVGVHRANLVLPVVKNH
jgi:hypothetical protein